MPLKPPICMHQPEEAHLTHSLLLLLSIDISKTKVSVDTLTRNQKGYRSKLDRWPRHVTPSEKRQFFDVITLFATYILGQKVDPIRNVTASQSHVLGQKVDPIRNVTASHFGFWAIGLIYSGIGLVYSVYRTFLQAAQKGRVSMDHKT